MSGVPAGKAVPAVPSPRAIRFLAPRQCRAGFAASPGNGIPVLPPADLRCRLAPMYGTARVTFTGAFDECIHPGAATFEIQPGCFRYNPFHLARRETAPFLSWLHADPGPERPSTGIPSSVRLHAATHIHSRRDGADGCAAVLNLSVNAWLLDFRRAVLRPGSYRPDHDEPACAYVR
jgi:hypothetical protein